MSNKALPTALLSLLQNLANTSLEVEVVEVRDGESLEDAIARAHRESCPDCAAEHAAGQVKDKDANAKSTTGEGIADQMREKLKAKQQHEREVLEKQQQAERDSLDRQMKEGNRYEGMRPEMSAPYGTAGNGPRPTREPIGYMAFHVTADGQARAIPPSFNEDRDAVIETASMVEQHPVAQLLSTLSGARVEIRPVFGE